jgi:hypothetical protein
MQTDTARQIAEERIIAEKTPLFSRLAKEIIRDFYSPIAIDGLKAANWYDMLVNTLVGDLFSCYGRLEQGEEDVIQGFCEKLIEEFLPPVVLAGIQPEHYREIRSNLSARVAKVLS